LDNTEEPIGRGNVSFSGIFSVHGKKKTDFLVLGLRTATPSLPLPQNAVTGRINLIDVRAFFLDITLRFNGLKLANLKELFIRDVSSRDISRDPK
jgi:hypothetical protein